MKQDIDTATLELPYMGEVITPDNSLPLNAKTYYRFYIETESGESLWWDGLTKKQARDMYAYTDAHQPSNAVRYGQPQTDIHITLSHDPLAKTAAPPGATEAPPAPQQMVYITLRNTVGEPEDASRPRHMASQGFGLGLSFVKTVIRKHQGHIQLDLPTQAGATAEVRVQLPMANPYGN